MTAKNQSGADFGVGDSGVTITAPTLLNSWANVSGYQTAGYSRSADGIVRLHGTIDTGTKSAGTDLFVLPAGFRPAAKIAFPVVDSTGSADAAHTIVVTSAGVVEVGAVALTASSAISLDSISFVASS